MEAQINALIELQRIDKALHVIQKKKGLLPDRIAGLEKEMAELKEKKRGGEEKIALQEAVIVDQRKNKKEAEQLMIKRQGEQLSTTDSHAYEVFGRDIALQEVEIQLAKKKTKEAQEVVKEEKELIVQIDKEIADKEKMISDSQQRLQEIEERVMVEEKELQNQRDSAVKDVEENLYHKYEEIRQRLQPPYAAVPVERDACSGCHIITTPQQQIDIQEKKKIIICEYCGCILTNVVVVEEKPQKRRRSAAS